MQDIKGTIFNITKSVTKTSGDLLKTTKLSMNLSSEETNLKNLYMEIGKKVHEIYQYGGSLGKFFDEKYLEIEASERKIADIREQISVIKGTRVCTKCGKTVDRSAEFCQKCGVRVELSTVSEANASRAALGTVSEVNVTGAELGHAYTVADDQPTAQQPPTIEQVYTPPAEPVPTPSVAPPPLTAPPEPVTSEPALRTCRVCNSKNEATSKFCLSCGRILD